jgi:salicylate hydroxylase
VTQQLLVAGGGIGGLAAALGARRAGWEVRLYEQASEFSEAGAGVQLGPNATRILGEWSLLADALDVRAARPAQLAVHDAVGGAQLGQLRLGDFEQRYGAPYLTVHRADLQAVLLQAAFAAGARLLAGRRIEAVSVGPEAVRVDNGVEGDALVAADGIWSRLRRHVIAQDEAPRFTGHVAYRALVRQAELPQGLRNNDVLVWLGPRLHLVQYPVRSGEWLNVVCLVEGRLEGDVQGWDEAAALADLQAAMGSICARARELVGAIPQWRLWALHRRAPLAGPQEMAAGRVALLGDAAHPMLPYLAQGAGMAIEDARELERVLPVADGRTLDVPTALRRYALSRWQRAARVQQRSLRNATIFHARGALRVARNLAMRAGGERVLDVPWLYGG